MATVSIYLRIVLHLLYLIFVNISTNHNVLCINKTHRRLISESEALVFPQFMDLEFLKFEVFEQDFERDDGNNAFTSRDNPSFEILVTEKEANMPIVLVDIETPKAEDIAGKICFVKTYIVFRPIKKFMDHFTSHIVHIRNIRGNLSVEWDFFYSKSRDFNGQFVSAFAPDNDVEDKTTWQNKGRMMRRLKKRIQDAPIITNETKYITDTFIPTTSPRSTVPSTFKGLGRCPESRTISLTDVVGQTLSPDTIIEYILEVLQVNCLPNFFENTKRLFTINLVQHVQGIQVNLNEHHLILSSPFLTEPQWFDLISALYLHAFTNAFTQGLNPNRTTLIQNDVSPSVRNLIGMTIQIIELIKLQGLKPHIVKILTTMLVTAKAASQYYAMEKENLAGCFDCKDAESLNQNNTLKITSVISILNCKVEKLINP